MSRALQDGLAYCRDDITVAVFWRHIGKALRTAAKKKEQKGETMNEGSQV